MFELFATVIMSIVFSLLSLIAPSFAGAYSLGYLSASGSTSQTCYVNGVATDCSTVSETGTGN